jgi:hypothetical protein
MIDNFAESLNALRRFIYANVPQGVPDRRLEDIEHQTSYLPLDFRRDDVSVSLYIELDSFASESFKDEQGNRWRKVKLTAKPSWPSYGSVDVEQAGRFIALLSEVNVFADKLLKEFNEPFVQLVETAEQAAERKQKSAEENSRVTVRSLMRANVKGMRVGQERRVEVPGGSPDLLPVGHVTFCDGPRQYTTNVTATRTVYVMRTA